MLNFALKKWDAEEAKKIVCNIFRGIRCFQKGQEGNQVVDPSSCQLDAE